jgi:hypothetical protein
MELAMFHKFQKFQPKTATLELVELVELQNLPCTARAPPAGRRLSYDRR